MGLASAEFVGNSSIFDALTSGNGVSNMTHSDFPVNIAEYIASARSDAALFRKARTTFADLSPHLWDRGDAKKTAITSSDAGRCAAQVKAECAGLYEIGRAHV